MSQLTISQIEAFYWTSTLGTVEAAARRLNLTQPSISLRLKTLQTQFSKPLFMKYGRGLRMTPQGQELLLRAERVLKELDGMLEETSPSQFSGPVRIGLSEGLALVCLPGLSELLHVRHPQLRLYVTLGTTATLEPELHAHHLDIVFVAEPTEMEEFTLVPLGVQDTSWIAGTNWNLPEVATPHDLIKCPIISNVPGSHNFQQVKGWFASAGIVPLDHDICNSVSMIANFVTRGAALGILPVKMTEPYVANGSVRVLDTQPPIADTPIYAKYPTHKFDHSARMILSAARQVLESMGYINERRKT